MSVYNRSVYRLFTLTSSEIGSIDDLKSNYDLIIMNLNKSLFDLNESDKVNAFLKVLSTIKTDETILISKNSYNYWLVVEKVLKL